MAQIVIKCDGKIVHRQSQTFDREQACRRSELSHRPLHWSCTSAAQLTDAVFAAFEFRNGIEEPNQEIGVSKSWVNDNFPNEERFRYRMGIGRNRSFGPTPPPSTMREPARVELAPTAWLKYLWNSPNPKEHHAKDCTDCTCAD